MPSGSLALSRIDTGMLGTITQWCLLVLVSDVTDFSERSLGNQAWLRCHFSFFLFSLPLCPFAPHLHLALQSWPEVENSDRIKQKDNERWVAKLRTLSTFRVWRFQELLAFSASSLFILGTRKFPVFKENSLQNACKVFLDIKTPFQNNILTI